MMSSLSLKLLVPIYDLFISEVAGVNRYALMCKVAGFMVYVFLSSYICLFLWFLLPNDDNGIEMW